LAVRISGQVRGVNRHVATHLSSRGAPGPQYPGNARVKHRLEASELRGEAISRIYRGNVAVARYRLAERGVLADERHGTGLGGSGETARPMIAAILRRDDHASEEYGVSMTHEEAKRESKRLMDQHPERDRHAWLPRQDPDGDWSVIKVRLPEDLRHGPPKATIEAKPKPAQADDPRPPMWRDVGGPYAGG
jgi:hypothetical protein